MNSPYNSTMHCRKNNFDFQLSLKSSRIKSTETTSVRLRKAYQIQDLNKTLEPNKNIYLN